MRLQLRVQPGAKRSGVVGAYAGGWKIRVTAPAEGGRANEEVLRVLADVLGVAAAEMRIVAGRTSRAKVVEIDGVEPDAVRAALTSAAD